MDKVALIGPDTDETETKNHLDTNTRSRDDNETDDGDGDDSSLRSSTTSSRSGVSGGTPTSTTTVTATSYNTSSEDHLDYKKGSPDLGNGAGCLSSIFPKLNIFKYLLLEPVCLLQGIGSSLFAVVWQNFLIERVCHVSYNMSSEICANLTEYPDQEKLVESTTSIYTMYQSLIESGFPIIISLFLIPWMEKFGEKTILLVTLIGWIINAALRTVLTFLPNLSPDFLVLSSIPVAISGAYPAFITALVSFVSSHTSVKSRTFRMAFLGVIWDLGSPIGIILADLIFGVGGYFAVFVTACGIQIGSFLYAVVMIPEYRPEIADVSPEGSCCCVQVFNCKTVLETFATYFRRRPGANRRCLILLTVSICLNNLAYMGGINFKYLYTRLKFGWNTDIFSDYATISTLLGIIGGNLLIFSTMKLFRISDVPIGLFSTLSNLVGYLTFAFATVSWQMYVGSVIQMFGTIITVVNRSIISKFIPKDEFGKVFCIVTCFEITMPFLSGPLFSLIYVNTLSILPGAVFIVCAGALGVVMLNFMYVSCKMKSIEETLLDNSATDNSSHSNIVNA